MKQLVLLIVLIIGYDVQAQNYMKRTAEEPVYDVEVIVFGRNLAQPAIESVQQAAVYSQQDAAEVNFLPPDEDWPVIKVPSAIPQEISPNEQSQSATDNNSPQTPSDQSDWQVPLNEEPIDYEVLVWYLRNQHLMGPVVNLLDNNPKYKTLMRQVWRQPTTPFSQPLYVKINNFPNSTADNTEESDFIQSDMIDFSFSDTDKPDKNDFQINGQVALSEGRFTHLHIKFNYYRINEHNDVLVYGSKQQRQIKLNQWQYFDHPQFGVLIKVTAVKAEELL